MRKTRENGAPWDHSWLVALGAFLGSIRWCCYVRRLGLEEMGEPSWGRVARARLAPPQKGWDPKGQKVNFLLHERYHLSFLDEIYRSVGATPQSEAAYKTTQKWTTLPV